MTTTETGIEAASPEKDSFVFAKVLTQSKDDPNKWISLATEKLRERGVSFKKSDITAKLETPVFARGESSPIVGFPSVAGAPAHAPPAEASPATAAPITAAPPPVAAAVQPEATAPKSIAPPDASQVTGPTSTGPSVASAPSAPAPVVATQTAAVTPVPPKAEEAKGTPTPKPPEDAKSSSVSEKPSQEPGSATPAKTAEAAPTDPIRSATIAPQTAINATIPSMALNAEVQAPRLPHRVLSYKDTSVKGWPVDVQLVTFPAPNHAALFVLQESGPGDTRTIAIMESVKTVN